MKLMRHLTHRLAFAGFAGVALGITFGLFVGFVAQVPLVARCGIEGAGGLMGAGIACVWVLIWENLQ